MVGTETPSHLKIYRGEEGDDGTDNVDNGTRRSIRDKARERCMRALESGLSGSRAWTQRDSREFRSENLSDRALSLVGIVTHEEQLRAILENESQHIPNIISKIHSLEPQFRAQITEARSRGWISERSASGWIARLEDSATPWWKKDIFIREKFPAYQRNWEKLGEDEEKVQKICAQKGIKPTDLREVGVLSAHGFKDATYLFRRGAVDKALAAIAAVGTNRKDLYDEAKHMLNQAVADDALSKAKIGTWLRRIFESNADPKKIEEFVMGKGTMPLPTLIWQWRKASLEFDKLEARITKEGKPPSFTFMTKKRFLDMHYESRMAYLQEAEYRMKDTQLAAIHPLLLDIRREIDAKDWGSAEYLMIRARALGLSPKDQAKLASMERHMNAQRSEQGGKSHEGTGDPHVELEALLAQVPASVQPLFRAAIDRGESVMRCLKSLWFNRDWCRKHGHLDDQKEEILRQRSERDTQKVLHEGHGKGYENISTRHGKPAVRKYHDGEWAPQVLHYSTDMCDSLVEDITTGKDNYAFKYWTTLVPKGVDFGTHTYVLHSIFPRMMQCVRRIDEAQGKAKAA